MKRKIINHFNGNYLPFFEKYLSGIKELKGDEYRTICCFHYDKNPSFDFSIKNGRYFCRGCQAKGDIFSFYAKHHSLSVKSDFHKILKGICRDFEIQNGKKESNIVAEYIYVDPDGKPRHKVARTESKDFYQSSYISGQWSRGTKGIDLVPYNLQAVIKADEIIIVEGEKDVDNLKNLGFVGTTNAMGAGCWRDSYNKHLKGKNIVLIPDNDGEGRKHMLNIAQSLDGQPKSLKWLELPGLQLKGDVSDFIEKFDGKDEAAENLAMLIKNAESWDKELQQKDKPYQKLKPATIKQQKNSEFPFSVLTGAAGYVADVFGDIIEAPTEFIFMSYLTCLGAAVSRNLQIASALKTQPRLFTVLLGESATERKSTTLNVIIDLFKAVLDSNYSVCWGLGSAEGLRKILKNNDEQTKSGTLLTFDELKAFVSKCGIDNSVLLPIVNTLFEANLYETHTKKESVKIEDAYLSMLAATTIPTYERIYTKAFLDIGFTNRVFIEYQRKYQTRNRYTWKKT